MKRLTIAISILLLVALTSSAVTPTTSNASLKGTYVFLVSRTSFNSWGQNLVCGGNPTFVGGSNVTQKVAVGTMVFDGAGGMTGTITQYGELDQNASNASASCASGGNGVFLAPESGTLTGSYSVQANATGTANITAVLPVTGGGTASFTLSLVGNCASTGVNDAILLNALKPNNAVENVGSARLQ